MNEKTKPKKNRLKSVILIFLLLFIISSFYLIYNIWLLSGIENIIRTCVIIFLLVIMLIFILSALKTIKKQKFKSFIIFIIITILIGGIQFVAASYINKAYSSISKMNKTEATYSTSLIVMSNSKINDVSDLKNKKIGIIKDTNNVEGYIISQDIIKEKNINKNNLVQYNDFLSILNDLYDGNISAAFLPGEYASMFGTIDNFENLKTETKALATKSKTMAKQQDTNTSNSGSIITKPFTMLLLGIDSTGDNIQNATSFNGDSIILVTFNPKTLNATMLSIPRDTFVPIACNKNQSSFKINSAAWSGEKCMSDTIKNLTGINIDYYVKINFTGLVKLVNAVGGVQVDVPYSFCEQNSQRDWGKNTIYVKKGLQTLMGEQALAFARNRHPNPQYCSKTWTNYYSDDLVRGQNQQTVIKAILDKIKGIRDINKIYEFLDLLEKNIDTNLSTNQILSFYNIGKTIMEHSASTTDGILNFQKLYLSTYGAMIYDESMKMNLSDQIYYKGSLKEDVDAMQINLGLKDPTIIKTFSFSINEPYEEKIIGKGTYNEAGVSLVPNLTKYTKSSAESWGIKNGVTITFKTVDSSESKYIDGQIIAQSIPTSSLLSVAKSRGITLTIINKIASSNDDKNNTSSKIDCTKENDSLCEVPIFEGKSLSNVTSWASKLTSNSVDITYKTKNDDICTDEAKNNIIFEQSGPSSLYKATNNNIIITYCKYQSANNNDGSSDSNNTQDPALNHSNIN